MHNSDGRQEGMALLLALLAVIVLLGATALVMTSVQNAKNDTDSALNNVLLDEACKAGIDIGIEKIWNAYLAANKNTPGSITSYRAFLDAIVKNNEVLDGVKKDYNADGKIEENSPATLIAANAPKSLQSHAQVTGLTLTRCDDPTGTLLIFTSTAKLGQATKRAMQTVRVSGTPFCGFQFALLANNINCILCHADFDNIERINNTDVSQRGAFERVRIASLESLLLRVTTADSKLAGSYYTRGIITDNAGNPLSTLSGTTFTGWAFSDQGKIFENQLTGKMTNCDLSPVAAGDDGKYPSMGRLYMNYPTTDDGMTDGKLPEKFPAPIPDENANKIVDSTEFAAFKATTEAGSIVGGTAYGLPSGQTYTGTTLPASSNSAAASLSSSGYYDGNLFLVGTAANPIDISGKVLVNGDVIISGPVKGTGQIYARNNVYFVGDTTYADASGTFGQASDKTKNLVAYVAGGNIMIGDYLTPMKMSNGWADVTSSSYLTSAGVDPGGPANSKASASFTMSEVTLFNKMEYQKAQADASYVPRYYRLRPTSPVYRFTGKSEHGDNYDSSFTAFTPPSKAAVLDLSPSGGWVSDLFLKKVWRADELSRPATGRPFSIDGLLYSNNAIFALARSDSTHNSRTFGSLRMRGGLIAADVGILGAGDKYTRGFVMYYDKRVGDFLRIEDNSEVAFERLAFRPIAATG